MLTVSHAEQKQTHSITLKVQLWRVSTFRHSFTFICFSSSFLAIETIYEPQSNQNYNQIVFEKRTTLQWILWTDTNYIFQTIGQTLKTGRQHWSIYAEAKEIYNISYMNSINISSFILFIFVARVRLSFFQVDTGSKKGLR